MSQLRLLLLVPAVKEKPETGGEHYNLKLARGLAKDWDVTVRDFASMPGFAREERAYDQAIQNIIAESGPFDAIVQDTYVYPFAKVANDHLAKSGPVIGFGQAIYSERFGRPWHRWRHDREMYNAIRAYSGLIVVSDVMKTHAVKLGYAAERVSVVAPGYALADYSPQATREDLPIRIVTAGSYQPAKGQLKVVQGFVALLKQRPDLRDRVRLDLYGNLQFAPDYVQEVQAAAKGLEDVIGVHGPIEQTQLWETFARSHIFAFLAQGEGVGMVTVEAMRCGAVPVLADDRLSRDLLGDTDFGVLVRAEPSALASGLATLIDDKEWLARSHRASARGEDLMRTWETTVDEFSKAVYRYAAGWPLLVN